MSLSRTLRRLAGRALRSPALAPPPSPPAHGRAASGAGPPRTSCEPRDLPPCPPCKPFPRPPCRKRGPDQLYAIQVTCCPPPRGHPPPCEPTPPACSMTCSQAKPLKPRELNAAYVSAECRAQKCGEVRNEVVWRHEAALAARREDYLREAAQRRAAPPARPAPAPARPPDPLQYKTATVCPPQPEPSACGVCAPFNKSQFRDAGGQVTLELDGPKKHPSACKEPVAGGAKYAGDSSWCGMGPPPTATPRCRPPSPRERLRRRAPCRDLPCLSKMKRSPKKH